MPDPRPSAQLAAAAAAAATRSDGRSGRPSAVITPRSPASPDVPGMSKRTAATRRRQHLSSSLVSTQQRRSMRACRRPAEMRRRHLRINENCARRATTMSYCCSNATYTCLSRCTEITPSHEENPSGQVHTQKMRQQLYLAHFHALNNSTLRIR